MVQQQQCMTHQWACEIDKVYVLIEIVLNTFTLNIDIEEMP